MALLVGLVEAEDLLRNVFFKTIQFNVDRSSNQVNLVFGIRIGTCVVAVYTMTRDAKDHWNKADCRVRGKTVSSVISCGSESNPQHFIFLRFPTFWHSAIGIGAPPRADITHVLVGVIVVPPASKQCMIYMKRRSY